MRQSLALVLGLFLVSASFALSDIGMLGVKNSLGYYLMPSSDGSNLSSGLVYNQKIDDNTAAEVLLTAYNSPYLITRNVTQIEAHGKRRLLNMGPVSVTGLLGGGLIYSPAVGGGLTGDFGGVAAARILENLAASLPVYVLAFTDGVRMSAIPTVNFKYGAYEIFGGMRVDASIVGNPSKIDSGGATGKVNTYLYLGLRTAI